MAETGVGWHTASVDSPPVTPEPDVARGSGSEGVGVVLLAGDDGLAVRVREELVALGTHTVSICSHAEALAAREATAAGAKVVIGATTRADTWHRAGVERSAAVGLLGAGDVDNLHAALLVEELHDDGPVVLRMFQRDADNGIQGLLGPRGRILSDAQLAAPAFLHAALSGNTGQRVSVAGRAFEVAEVDPGNPALVVALCNADTPTDVLPGRDELGERVLGLIDPYAANSARGTLPVVAQQAAERRAARRGEARRRRSSKIGQVTGWFRLIPRRAFVLLAVMLTVMLASATVFNLGTSSAIDQLDAIYFTVTTMATVGYGDVNLLNEPDWVKIYGIFLMGLSAVLLGAFLAMVTEVLVSTRLDQALGRYPRPRADHVVVCGLGQAGTAVLTRLHAAEVPCIGIEHNEQAAGLAVARALKIPVIIGDARTPGTLEDLHLDRARALMALTTDDLANIQCALKARELNSELRVVLRCFDQQLAARLDHTIDLDLTRSVADLAAPQFAAALLGRALTDTLPISNVPLRVLETVVPVGSAIAGGTVGDAEARGGLRFLHCDGRWRPRPDYPISAGEPIAVVGTREACDELLRA